MNRSFLLILAILNSINILILLASPSMFDEDRTHLLNPMVLLIFALIYFAAYFVVTILNTIYFFKDKYRIVGFSNIGLILGYFCLTLLTISKSSGIFQEDQYQALDLILNCSNILFALTFGISIFIFKNRENRWLKICAGISILSVLVGLVEVIVVHSTSNQTKLISNLNQATAYITACSLLFFVVHLLRRKNQVSVKNINDAILDN